VRAFQNDLLPDKNSFHSPRHALPLGYFPTWVGPSPHFANSLESRVLRFFRDKYRLLKELGLNSFESCAYVARFGLRFKTMQPGSAPCAGAMME
jgi:hypothetical protein